MQDQALGIERRNEIACARYVGEDRLGRENSLQHLPFAASTRPVFNADSAARYSGLPPAGGVQSTCTTGEPAAARSRANAGSPMFMTRTGPESSGCIGGYLRESKDESTVLRF